MRKKLRGLSDVPILGPRQDGPARLLRLNVQVNRHLLARIIRTDGLSGALFVFELRPDQVVGVRRKLAESVASIAGGDKAANLIRFGVFEVYDGASQRTVSTAQRFALQCFGCGFLRQGES
jgi:hypothetical protein